MSISGNNTQPIRHWLEGFIHNVFSLLFIALILLFWIVLLSPGPFGSEWVFSLIQPLTSILQWIYSGVGAPVIWFCDWLVQFLPAGLHEYFPTVRPDSLYQLVLSILNLVPDLYNATFMQPIRAFQVSTIFPGVIDWRILMTIWLWTRIEEWLTPLFRGLNQHEFKKQYQRNNSLMARDFQSTASPEWQVPAGSTSFFTDTNTSAQALPEAPKSQFPEVTSALREEINVLQNRVYEDELTSLYNKAYFHKKLDAAFAEAKIQNKHLGLMFIDLDNFKQVNDQYGHPVGDQVLQQVAYVLKGIRPIQGECVACRYGGEELCVILIDQPMVDAKFLAEQTRAQINALRFQKAPDLSVSGSLGLYNVRFQPDNGSYQLSSAKLIELADEQAYKAKNSGKNRVCADGIQ